MFRGVVALVAAAVTGAGAGSAPTPGAVELDGVVAVVRAPGSDLRVITRSRLEDETRIALVARGGTLAASEPLDGAALQAGLAWLVDETLLMDEATRLRVFDGDAADGDELSRFRARFGRAADYQAFLRRWSITEDEVGAVLRRMTLVKRYVDSRVSHAAQVSEADVSAWLDEHATELGTRDRDVARARLAEVRMAAEVKALLRALRSRAEVRFLGSFASSAGRPGTSTE
jgi:hypothetical protein